MSFFTGSPSAIQCPCVPLGSCHLIAYTRGFSRGFSRVSSQPWQDDILRLLATSEGDVLEDDTLVDKARS